MAVTFFPDTTVLINFGYLGRLDVLERLLSHRVWCLTVSSECQKSYSALDFDTYPKVRALFGEPLTPTRTERIDLHRLRDDIAAPGDRPDAHLGEAETITIATGRNFEGPVLITDDVGATRLARREGLTAINTWQLIRAAVRSASLLTEDEAWDAATTLRGNRRGWPKGVGHSRAEFIAWLRS